MFRLMIEDGDNHVTKHLGGSLGTCIHCFDSMLGPGNVLPKVRICTLAVTLGHITVVAE